MTLTAQENTAAPGREPGRCRYPGCPDPARASDAPGRPPGYCGQDVPEDRDGTPVMVRHTAMTAFRRRQLLAGQRGDGKPVTAAISRYGHWILPAAFILIGLLVLHETGAPIHV